jgi:hypothetical protein
MVAQDEDADGPTVQWACFCNGGNYAERGNRCPVCQGAGRISDVMPAKDALADAETLRGFWHELARETGVEARFHLTQQTTARLWQNGMFGHYLPWECADSASSAARAAFRAVPGLKVPDFEHECAVCA